MSFELLLKKTSDKGLPIKELKCLLELHRGNTQIEATVVNSFSVLGPSDEIPYDVKILIIEILTHLAYSTDMSIRWAVAKNKLTSISVLKILSYDKINLVRALVATNPNTPTAVLKRLFNDAKIVRDGLSGNPSTPLKYLMILTDDSDPMVRLRVLENPSSKKAIYQKLLLDSNKNIANKAHEKLQRLNHALPN